MNFANIKFKNLEEFGGDLPLPPDGTNAHDLRVEPLRKELHRLGVPVSADMSKARMCGIYSQCLEHIVNEGSPYSRTLNAVNMREAAKELGRRPA